MSRLRYKRRKLAYLQELSLTPLIDTALTLLIIFMIASPMLHNGVQVNMPQANVKEDVGLSQQVVITIDKDQNVFYKDRSICLQELVVQLKNQLLEQSAGTVYLRADQAVPYGFVMHVIEHVKAVQDVKHVILVTKKSC